MKNIIVDAMGGDLAPQQIVYGALDAVNEDKDVKVTLVGKKDAIDGLLAEQKYSGDRIFVIDAQDVITNDESPTMAIKLKKESSLVKAFEALMSDGDAFVSCGATGAVLVGAFMKVGRIKGVSRPALAPMLPTLTGGRVILCDCGANVDCKPVHLAHFAIMASAYATAMLGVEKPRVGLLNNGVEEHKGSELAKEAYEKLKTLDGINFVGNCEARDILSGDFDVVVADGFNGNIALKSTEGAAGAVVKLILDGVNNGGLRAKLGALLLKPVLKSVKKTMDYNAYGGACFLGVNKVVVKSHGASKRKSVAASILQAKELADRNICEDIKRGIINYNSTAQEE